MDPGIFANFKTMWARILHLLISIQLTHTREMNYSAFERSGITFSFWFCEPIAFGILVSHSCTATSRSFYTLCCPLYGDCSNKTGTSKVGAISKAQKAQSFLNMPRMYS